MVEFDATITPTTVAVVMAAVPLLYTAVDKWLAFRKLSTEDKAAAKAGCMKQIEMLWEENRKRGAEVEAVNEKLRICREDGERMYKQIVEQEEKITGLKRQISQVGLSAHHAVQDVMTDKKDDYS